MNFSDQKQDALVWSAASGFNAGAAVHGFSTRLGGVSQGPFASLNLGVNRGDDLENVRENFHRFCAAVGADADRLVSSKQVHKADVRIVTTADAGKGLFAHRDYEADALVTDVPGLPLAVFSADCIPVLFHDPVRHVVAAAHAGWRGTALGIVQKTVERMEEVFACRPADILAAVGPGISQCCFETREDVPNAMMGALGSSALPFIRSEGGHFHVDLKGLNSCWLTRAGLVPEHIAVSTDCTCCQPERYWSHRKMGDARGSMAAVVMLLGEGAGR